MAIFQTTIFNVVAATPSTLRRATEYICTEHDNTPLFCRNSLKEHGSHSPPFQRRQFDVWCFLLEPHSACCLTRIPSHSVNIILSIRSCLLRICSFATFSLNFSMDLMLLVLTAISSKKKKPTPLTDLKSGYLLSMISFASGMGECG